MSSDIPNVSEDLAIEPDVQLFIGHPNRPGENSIHSMIRDAHDIQVAWTEREHSSLSFKVYKDSPGNELLQGDWEIIARLWDPRVGKWLEPPNSRFVVMESDEDMVDETNEITYTCVQTTWLLEKVRVRTTNYVNHALRLNRDYDRAQEAYEEAEREYDSVFSDFDRTARRIQEHHWPNISKGPNFAQQYFGWLVRDRKVRWRSIVYTAGNRTALWWYSSDRRAMTRLNMTSGGSSVVADKERLLQLGPEVIRARTAMNRARSSYAAAERAARESSRDGTRYFYNRTPGRIITTLWREGWERDTGFVGHNDGEGTWDSPYDHGPRILKGLWRHFTATRDARGRLWTASTPRRNWEIRLGQSLWSVIQDFTERGLIDWRQGGLVEGGGGRSLQLVPHGSLEVDQTRRVALRLGHDVDEAPQTISRDEHQTVTLILSGLGVNHYHWWNRGLEANQTPWGIWEGSMDEPDAEGNNEARELTGPRRQELSRRYAIDASRRVTVRPYAPLPMLDYEPHHIVSVYDHEGSMEPRKVTQIILEKESGESPLVATVRFGTRRTNSEVSYAKTMSKVLGGTDHIQGHIKMEPRLEPNEIPGDALYAPAITSMGARVRFNEAGRPQVWVNAAIAAHDVPVPEDAAAFEETQEAADLIEDEVYEGE